MLAPHDFNLLVFAIGIAAGVATREDNSEQLVSEFIQLLRVVTNCAEEEPQLGTRQ